MYVVELTSTTPLSSTREPLQKRSTSTSGLPDPALHCFTRTTKV